MHIVFIVGSYYPNYSAVGKCVGNVADVLAKRHKVTVICEKSYISQNDTDEFNNQKILRFITKEKINRERIGYKINSSFGIRKKIYQSCLMIIKILQACKLICSKTSIKKELVNQYLDKLTELEDIDVVIPACMPFESVVAAFKYKKLYNKRVVLIPYLFDRFTDSPTLHRFYLNKMFKRRRHLKLEESILSFSDSVIAMHTLKRFYETEMPTIKHIHFMEHPLILPADVKNISESEIIKIAYIGGFYKNYVEPEYLLELLSRSRINARTEFYVIGNCDNIIDKYSRNNPSRIINRGSVDKETANKKISENDILINVAEKSGMQLSSKIFDYISYGKPIIHLYKTDNDINLKILEKYPLALCIKEDKALYEQNLKEFENFCLENHNKRVSVDEVKKLYPDAIPEYTAQLIEDIIYIS